MKVEKFCLRDKEEVDDAGHPYLLIENKRDFRAFIVSEVNDLPFSL